MREKIAQEWIARLRSGEYSQRIAFLDLDGAQCCLGILTQMALEQGAVECTVYLNQLIAYGEGEHTRILPSEVIMWSGMSSDCGILPQGNTYRSLSLMNDDGRSFEEIASIIEANWGFL